MSPLHSRVRLRLLVTIWVAADAVALAGCAPARPGAVRSDREVIERAEIEQHLAVGITDMYDLIQRARPRWLERRGDRSFALETVILVYHHQQRLGDIEILRNLRPDNVVRIERLDAAAAGLLPGARNQHVEAAIVFETIEG